MTGTQMTGTQMTGTEMTDVQMTDALLAEGVERLLAERCPPEVVRRAEATGWVAEVWEVLAEAGFPWVSVPEEAGGSGGSVADACAVLHHAGRHAAPVPLAETGLLGGWLLARAGLPLPDGPLSVAPGRPADTLVLSGEGKGDGDGWRLDGRAERVPWASWVERIVLLVPAAGSDALQVCSVPAEGLRVEAGRNLAGERRDTVVFDGVRVAGGDVAPAPEDVDHRTLRLRGGLSRAALMAGAMERVSELSVAYASERQQFGRAIAQFQAVQHHLVRIAAEAALAKMAVSVAAQALADHELAGAGDGDSDGAAFDIAAARCVADEAARTVTARAHQVHGAIGMTQEHELQLRTRRLWAWADEWGNERSWRALLGGQVVGAGPDRLWPRLTTGLVGRA